MSDTIQHYDTITIAYMWYEEVRFTRVKRCMDLAADCAHAQALIERHRGLNNFVVYNAQGLTIGGGCAY